MLPGARALTLLAALGGVSGVALAALGSHLVSGLDGGDGLAAWRSANQMHLLHSVALLATAVWERAQPSAWLRAAGLGMVLGMAAFSGSIYLSVALGTSTGGIAPLGGLLLMGAWVLLAVAGLQRPEGPR